MVFSFIRFGAHENALRGALAFDDAVQAARFKSPRPIRFEPMAKR